MSIVHKALKKAESDALKRSQGSGSPYPKRRVELERPSPKRVIIIFFIFFVLLLLAYYYPIYINKKSLKKSKESISITPAKVPVETIAASSLKEPEKSVDDSYEDNAKGLNLKGIYFIKKGDYEKALSYFVAASKKDKSDHEIYNNMGYALKKLGKYKVALKSYEKALSLNKDHKETNNNIGVLYDRLGKYDDAVKAFSRAIEIDEDYADPYFNIAVTYEKMKKYKLARENYVMYLDFFKERDDEFISGIRKKVEILKKL